VESHGGVTKIHEEFEEADNYLIFLRSIFYYFEFSKSKGKTNATSHSFIKANFIIIINSWICFAIRRTGLFEKVEG